MIATKMVRSTQNETYSNLREWESRTWGKFLNRNTVPANLGIIDFGEDAMLAYQEELGYSPLQAQNALYLDFVSKGQDSVDRMNKINSLDEGTSTEVCEVFPIRRTMIPIAMEFLTGGSTVMPSSEWMTRRHKTTGRRTR